MNNTTLEMKALGNFKSSGRERCVWPWWLLKIITHFFKKRKKDNHKCSCMAAAATSMILRWLVCICAVMKEEELVFAPEAQYSSYAFLLRKERNIFFLTFICLRAQLSQQRERERENAKPTPCSPWNPMQGLIPWPWDHDLSWTRTCTLGSRPLGTTEEPWNIFFWI